MRSVRSYYDWRSSEKQFISSRSLLSILLQRSVQLDGRPVFGSREGNNDQSDIFLVCKLRRKIYCYMSWENAKEPKKAQSYALQLVFPNSMASSQILMKLAPMKTFKDCSKYRLDIKSKVLCHDMGLARKRLVLRESGLIQMLDLMYVLLRISLVRIGFTR